ncbi:MAG: hypothetical protein COA65_08045 [Rhodospirillaceae bacterium]|nr:MAG: hypothetical protein COA65_08045 [Rhodospirillaceae bacterium]
MPGIALWGHFGTLQRKEANPSHLRSVDPAPEEPGSSQALESLQVQMGADFLESAYPVYMADLDGQLLYTNEAFDALCQVSDDGTTTAPPFSLQEIVDAVRRDAQAFHHSFSLRRGAHNETFHSRHFPVHDSDGTLVAVAGSVQNLGYGVSLRKQVAAERKRFEDLARLVSDWLWETDAHFNFTYASSRIFDLVGVLPRELEGQSLFTFGRFQSVGESIDRPGPDMRSPFREELYEVPLPEGGVRTFRLSGLPIFDDENGKFCGYRGTAEDVTNETLAWSRAIKSRMHLVEAIESIQDAFVIFDDAEKLVLCNSRFRQNFLEETALSESDTTLEDILRVNVESDRIVVPEQDPAWFIGRLRQLRRESGSLELELRGGVWVNFTLQRITDGGWIGFFSDITGLKEREANLQSAKDAAEAASLAKSEFLANMSHELRTPLNAVIGFSEVMHRELMGPLGSDSYRNYAGDILESGRHLLGIINTILDVSKAEAGGLDLEEQLIDLCQTTEAALRVVRQKAVDGDVRLACRIAPGLPRFRGDATKLKQILLNLLANAIKFTPEGGRIDVDIARCPNGGLRIDVTDTGIGIAAEDIATALAPFGQIDSAIGRRYPGTGLGLPLTKKLVELHGGTLSLSSVPDQGTKVAVWFPPERLETQDFSPSPANAT